MSTPGRTRPLGTWKLTAVTAFFGLFYAYVVWTSVALLIQMATGPNGLTAVGWFVYSMPILITAVAFGLAFAVGSRRRVGELSLVLLAGLTLSSAFWLATVAYAATASSLYGG